MVDRNGLVEIGQRSNRESFVKVGSSPIVEKIVRSKDVGGTGRKAVPASHSLRTMQ